MTVATRWIIRAGNLCSTEGNLREERKHLKKVFADNGYPKSVIRRWTTAQGRKRAADTRQAATRRVTLPYVKGASEVAARLLRKHGIEVVHKPANTLHGALTKVKDMEVEENKTGVVYGIGCGNFGTRYIGETGKKLSTRIKEHQSAVNRKDGSSTIYWHCQEEQHEMDWDNVGVKYRNNMNGERLFLEAWEQLLVVNSLCEGRGNIVNVNKDLGPSRKIMCQPLISILPDGDIIELKR
ncbi:uncharacterized protein LOC143039766 [Oratosquilla oratoria]|uniref:uncharacterized protein LOC143039766 n=1 Tax=Oratosquilla oratoria TaxID=337810 RepID=UPI003F75E68F